MFASSGIHGRRSWSGLAHIPGCGNKLTDPCRPEDADAQAGVWNINGFLNGKAGVMHPQVSGSAVVNETLGWISTTKLCPLKTFIISGMYSDITPKNGEPHGKEDGK